MSEQRKKSIIIVGGGTAGITVAAQLMGKMPNASMTIIEPSDKHYYQPLWTLVGGGIFPKQKSEDSEARYIPRGVHWVRDYVTAFAPESNRVHISNGPPIDYDYLIVAPGIQINWSHIKGLKETIGSNNVCSNYSYEHVEYTWECIKNFKGGTAVFTVPSTAVKCGGAPQKIMYLACDHFRRTGIADQCRVVFASALGRIFSVPKYAATLEKVIERYQIEKKFKHNLVEIRGENREADFENLETKERVTMTFDMLHVTPPMGPPDFVRTSALADEAGWVDVDKHTLQHKRFPNVFSLGDASSLPTSKTGAAVRKQAPVLVANLLSCDSGKPMSAKYDGYSSCPIVTAYGKMMLAEFDYNHEPKESFPFDQSKERWSMWLLKLYGLPLIYWKGMLRGWL